MTTETSSTQASTTASAKQQTQIEAKIARQERAREDAAAREIARQQKAQIAADTKAARLAMATQTKAERAAQTTAARLARESKQAADRAVRESRHGKTEAQLIAQYPQIVPGSVEWDERANKQVAVIGTFGLDGLPDGGKRALFTSDLFQVFHTMPVAAKARKLDVEARATLRSEIASWIFSRKVAA